MSDLTSILRVTQKQAAEIADIPKVVRDWEDQIQRYSRELEGRLPELEEYFRLEKIPYKERDEIIPRGSDAYKAYAAAYSLFVDIRRFPKGSYNRMHNLGGREIFLALLQKYEMPPAIRKKVEVAAKFWAKTRVQDAKKGSEVEAFKKIMQLYRDHLAIAKTAMASSVGRSTATPDQVKTWTAGPFRLLNAGGFDDKAMEECAQVVEKASQLMKAKGLGKVLYGDIIISNTVGRSSRILAFYLPSKDEMFVRANLKNVKTDALHMVTHELAHRLQFKFLSSKKREINTLYQNIAHKSRGLDQEKLQVILNDPSLRPQTGDTVKDGKGNVYEVDIVVYDKVHLHLQEEPKVKAKVSLLGYVQMKGLKVEVPGKSGFITQYAATDADENFAEMVAFYCMGGLAPDQVELLEQLLG